jgi:hypothetical protein
MIKTGQYKCEGFKLKWTDTQNITSFTFSVVFREKSSRILNPNEKISARIDLLGIYAAFALSYDRLMVEIFYLNDFKIDTHYYNFKG